MNELHVRGWPPQVEELEDYLIEQGAIPRESGSDSSVIDLRSISIRMLVEEADAQQEEEITRAVLDRYGIDPEEDPVLVKTLLRYYHDAAFEGVGPSLTIDYFNWLSRSSPSDLVVELMVAGELSELIGELGANLALRYEQERRTVAPRHAAKIARKREWCKVNFRVPVILSEVYSSIGNHLEIAYPRAQTMRRALSDWAGWENRVFRFPKLRRSIKINLDLEMDLVRWYRAFALNTNQSRTRQGRPQPELTPIFCQALADWAHSYCRAHAGLEDEYQAMSCLLTGVSSES